MNRDDIVQKLKAYEPELRARGVTHAALFGSRARGDNRPDSDTDIMIDIDPAADISIYDYAGLKRYIASLFDGAVDVVDRDALRPYVRPPAEGDAVLPSKRSKPSVDLFHIRDNIILARSFIEGVAYEQFRDDHLLFYGVTRALEIISEASRRLPAEMKKRHPDIPWMDIAGDGSIYRHDYEDVSQRRVWGTASFNGGSGDYGCVYELTPAARSVL